MGWTDCYVNQRIECCRLFSKLVNTSDDRIVKIIFNWSKSNGRCWVKTFSEKYARAWIGRFI